MYVIYPIFWVLLEILVAPVRLVLALANYVAMLFVNMYYLLGETWSSVSAMLQFASTSKTSVSRLESSMWRSLWNDLFSQVIGPHW